MSKHNTKATFAILIATKDGANFIREQIHSLLDQDLKDFDLIFLDDGSNDKTLEIVRQETCNTDTNIIIKKCNHNSFQKNFLYGLKNIDQQYKYYAFCDQDDVWMPDKLQSLLEILEQTDKSKPTMIASRTTIIDYKNNIIAESPMFRKSPSFKNALVQSLAGGNTMIINHATRNILDQIEDYESVVSHDWITYILVTAMSGKVIFSIKPLVHYRFHEKNIIGPNTTLSARASRVYSLLKGDFTEWSEKNILILSKYNLPKETQELFNHFKNMRSNNLILRVSSLLKLRPYRQTLMATILLIFAIVFRKI